MTKIANSNPRRGRVNKKLQSDPSNLTTSPPAPQKPLIKGIRELNAQEPNQNNGKSIGCLEHKHTE